MKALLIAAALIATPAQAKTWSNCSTELVSAEKDFVLTLYAGAERDETVVARCKIANWPISSPVAEIECDDGGPTSKMEFVGEKDVRFDGEILYGDNEDGRFDGICD